MPKASPDSGAGFSSGQLTPGTPSEEAVSYFDERLREDAAALRLCRFVSR